MFVFADAESPRVSDCPQSFQVQLAPGETSRQVRWKEPVFTDNVAVVLPVYKSKEPGQKISVGLHHVNYLALDAEGNRAKCHFSVHVKESGYRSDGRDIRPAASRRRFVVCPGQQEVVKIVPIYQWTVPSGCFLRRTRTQMVAYHHGAAQSHSGPTATTRGEN
ncbi:unnamed protein product [Timema podura]|uniref:HYR domain-containing protein n=1 Tax=Timema podura TaxID=61482 RepID=A0ABN7PLS9_TIMPD|nr:unnamed protein product [Timema podura]